MKKALSFISALALLATATACGGTKSSSDQGNGDTGSSQSESSNGGGEKKEGKQTINLWSFTDEVPKMVEKYISLHPEFAEKYTVKTTIVPTTEGAYQPALDKALTGGGSDAPDMYCAEAAFVLKYTQGEMASYAAPYKDLGIDVDNEIKAADIAQYTVDIGSNNGNVVGLGYQATGGAFIYRRSVAKAAFGSDDPKTVEEKIGGGSNSWDKFFECAEELKGKGYGIVSGDGDIWHAVENSSPTGWVVDGKLNIDPKREEFLDLSKKLKDNGYHNDTEDWGDAWFADMKGEGSKEVLGFFGPAWLINYTLSQNCGSWKETGEKDENGDPIKELDTSIGTYGDWAVCQPPIGFFWGGTWVLANKDSKVKEGVGEIIDWITLNCTQDGLQYMWANGTFDTSNPTKDCVASGTVLKMSNGEVDFLGGQNMFDAFEAGNKLANGKNLTPYDETINQKWRGQVRQYTAGNKSRDEAIKDFKQEVADELDIH
ncbi:ABC transporter substrate-binding protein [Ruminococcus flavefaciens]|uniref:ABC transporter substrate-binding protein n=1 Tax=Ruminococcus flavefaciens TaxID=1265 RepID=UPI0026F0B08D|nr:ABC transporter substrate-binding protein [Ruminococcus flavefaciens]